ncbi:MAG TPA: STAS domain-containing protein, partial [Acidimicrobiales bacterium]|nr:STAS domain-containing protein [Acidimicrobiales bacterium]
MSIVEDRGHLTVPITLSEIDIRTAPAFSEELRAALAEAERTGARHLTLDLDAVTFIDSMGIGALIDTSRIAGERGCRLDLAHVNRPV